MQQRRTEIKKILRKSPSKRLLIKDINTLVSSSYNDSFRVYRMSSTRTAIEYVSGLLCCEKGHENMERMVEKVTDSDYKRYIHFLSVSNWSAQDVNLITMKGSDKAIKEQKLKSGLPTGFTIDETAHLKKGDKSVGVARQYAGIIGKVDNCQVSVHASLSNQKYCTLVGTELFLPKEWIDDKARCQQAGIPLEERKYQTKPELAFKLIKRAIDARVGFDISLIPSILHKSTPTISFKIGCSSILN